MELVISGLMGLIAGRVISAAYRSRDWQMFIGAVAMYLLYLARIYLVLS